MHRVEFYAASQIAWLDLMPKKTIIAKQKRMRVGGDSCPSTEDSKGEIAQSELESASMSFRVFFPRRRLFTREPDQGLFRV